MAVTSVAGTTSITTGIAKEEINNTLSVDLVQFGLSYRFDNGWLLGTSAQKGYPNMSVVPKEMRYEATLGYSTNVDNFFPYATVSIGLRERDNLPNINYYAINLGTKYLVNENFYTDMSYRFRDTNDIKWQTHTYFVGVGYNVTRSVSIQGQYGKTFGDFKSDQFGIVLINRF